MSFLPAFLLGLWIRLAPRCSGRWVLPLERRAGFTLIEVLVVLSIMGILSASFLLNTSRAKETQEELLLRESVLALLQQERMEVSHGRSEGEAELKFLCLGMYFAAGEIPLRLEGSWDGSACTVQREDPIGSSLDRVAVFEIEAPLPQSNLTVWFTPPRGELQILDAGQQALEGTVTVKFSESGAFLELSSLGLPSLHYPD